MRMIKTAFIVKRLDRIFIDLKKCEESFSYISQEIDSSCV